MSEYQKWLDTPIPEEYIALAYFAILASGAGTFVYILYRAIKEIKEDWK